MEDKKMVDLVLHLLRGKILEVKRFKREQLSESRLLLSYTSPQHYQVHLFFADNGIFLPCTRIAKKK